MFLISGSHDDSLIDTEENSDADVSGVYVTSIVRIDMTWYVVQQD
jgi:hypothetical protein